MWHLQDPSNVFTTEKATFTKVDLYNLESSCKDNI